MGEYQYDEWQTVDRLLTEAAQVAVGRLSSREAYAVEDFAGYLGWIHCARRAHTPAAAVQEALVRSPCRKLAGETQDHTRSEPGSSPD